MGLANLFKEMLDCIYPDSLYCICCGKIIDDSRTYRLCDDCFKSMKWIGERTCDRCGKVLSKSNPGRLCFNCREHAHSFGKGFTCTEYGAHERAIVFALKYDDRTDIARTIGEIMADRMLAIYSKQELQEKYDILVPIPVSSGKKSSRGYNQAALISEYLAKNTGLVYRGEILERRNETIAMKGLSPDERRRNIQGCFGLIDNKRSLIESAKCLVADDIYTTGATVDEVAGILLENGAEKVDFITFSAGADMVKSL